MTSLATRPSGLLIEADRNALDKTRQVLRRHPQLADFALASTTETEAVEQLQEAAAAGEAPEVIFVGPSLTHTAALTREMQRLSLTSHLLFLCPGGQTSANFEQTLSHLPIAGLHWSVLGMDRADFGEEAEQAAHSAQRRAGLQTTLKRANNKLQSYRSGGGHQSRSSLSDYYLASFLAHAQDAIVATDSNRRVRYWSAGAERLFGLRAATAIGAAANTLPFWSEAVEDALDGIPQQGDTLTVEASYAKGKEQITVESVCSAVRDETGQFVGLALIIRDVTERQRRLDSERAERTRVTRLIDSERRHLRLLFEQAPGFIAVTEGSQHVFEVVNDAFLQLVGQRSLLDKPAAEALPEMQGQTFLGLLDQVYESGEAHVGRGIPLATQRKRGSAMETRFIDFVFQPIVEEDGSISGIFCQGNDVTEQKLAEEELAQHQLHLEELVEQRTLELQDSQEALHRSQKLEAIGQLTGGVAHDFNNVLQIISGNLQLLQLQETGKRDPQQRQAYLETAIDAVERGSKLSSQLLAFARRQPLQPASVDLGRTLRAMDDLLRRALGETIEIETVVAGGLWATMVDPHQLENVVLNLAINARDAMPGGGKLTLEVGNASLDDDYVRHQPDVPAGQYVVLAISDTGCGMSPEIVERAFDPFFTTKKEGEGTGLGLSMAYGFTKQSGGHIRIYSEPGNGTTVRIYLPRSYEEVAEPPKPFEGPARGGTETILVVEDDPAVRETVVQMLNDLGYKVLQADGGQSALNVLKSGVIIDMLFTDVVMPGPIRSTELAKQAKDIFPDIAVLFTSGYTQNAIVHGGKLDPGVDLLSKPYRREDLARKLRRVLEGSKTGESGQAQGDMPLATSLRILVVEDDKEGQLALCDLLEALGHRPRGVASAEDAGAALKSGEFDLLLTDLNLPGRSGIQLAKHARTIHPGIPVVIASGAAPELPNSLQPPPVVLPKPFDLNTLQGSLRIAMAG